MYPTTAPYLHKRLQHVVNERDARDCLGTGHLAPREREASQTLSETTQADYDPPALEQMPWRKMASDSGQKLDTVITSADFEPKQQEGCRAKIAGTRPVVATEITEAEMRLSQCEIA